MSEKTLKALLNAAASSEMEGLPIDAEKFNVIAKILNREMTLQDYLDSVRLQYQEN